MDFTDTSAGREAPKEYRPIGAPVEIDAAEERVDGYLARRYPFFSRAAWQRRIREGGLLVNDTPVKVATRLQPGDRIVMYYPQLTEPEVDRGIRVLWTEGGVMAVYKPGNLPMHENGPYRKNTFAALLAEKVGSEWAALHRLDRETSGIVLCSAGLTTRQRLSDDWASRRVHKEYLAIAHGVTTHDHWDVNGPIGDLQASRIRIKKWVVPDGLEALTHFQTEARSVSHSLIRAFPKTGRTNQIRIHSAFSGHHLVGDKTYHPDEDVFLEYFAKGNTENVQQKTGFVRMCLHATRLVFVHPETGREVDIVSPLPEDMLDFWVNTTSV